jgi:tetratricopeptide (TPR) repeat protein
LPALLAAGLLLAAGIGAAFLTRPPADCQALLTQAEGLIEHEEYQSALAVLNHDLRGAYDRGQLSAEQGRRFRMLRGRAVYLGEKRAGAENEENARTVVEEYAGATSEGAPLPARDQFFLADANVTLGRFQRAIDLAAALPGEHRDLRERVFKRVVERQLATPGAPAEETVRLLAEFLKDPAVTARDRAWALARQGELLLKEGMAEQAISKLVQTMPSVLADAGPELLGELYLLLGRAYWETQEYGDAGPVLEQAAGLLIETDERRAEATVLLGKIDELTRQPPDEARAEAKQKYTWVVEHFPSARVVLPALLGLGEVEAAMGEFDASLGAYTDLARLVREGRRHPDVSAGSIAASLIDRHHGRLDSGDFGLALRYATLAESLFSPDATPADVLLAVARAHRKAGEGLLNAPGQGRPADLARLDPATREQARVDLIAAGTYFRRHAERVGIADNAAFGQSLWMGADSFDRAGEPEQAIPLFADYAKFFPEDRRQAEARYRLGQAYQARGDYGTAAEYYRGLREDAAGGAGSVGPYGDLSAVPLARALLMDADHANDAEAQALLEDVVRGGAGGTTTPQFRDGLVELAMLKHRRGDFAGAIGHLEESVARFPDDPMIDDLRYALADSYRQDAHAIAKSLDEGMPDHRKQALREVRLERLQKALGLFEEVRRSLEARDRRRLSHLEEVRLRNSYFYLGDCDFDLRDFEGAIRHYDAARERYPKDPASLVAMTQIVSAYLELGDLERARTANNRAKQFYDSLPPSVWSDPDLPMGSDDWKHWLESMARLMPARPGEEPARQGAEVSTEGPKEAR